MDQRTKRGLKPGQLDPETAEFAHRARELAGRRSYLKNFWYAAGARPLRPALLRSGSPLGSARHVRAYVEVVLMSA